MLCGSHNTDANGEILKNVHGNVDNDIKCEINIIHFAFCSSDSEMLSDIAWLTCPLIESVLSIYVFSAFNKPVSSCPVYMYYVLFFNWVVCWYFMQLLNIMFEITLVRTAWYLTNTILNTEFDFIRNDLINLYFDCCKMFECMPAERFES